MHTFKTNGTCSISIQFEVEDDIITHCEFERGCTGNAQGLARLVVGLRAQDVIEKLRGIECQNGTSCPDQLAVALEKWLEERGEG